MKVKELVENLKKLNPELEVQEALTTPAALGYVTPETSVNPELRRIFGHAGPGQPPKPEEERRKHYTIYISAKELELVEAARDREAPTIRLGAYIRDVAVEHARQILE